MDFFKDICQYLWKELVLAALSVVFMFFLNNFNKELLSKFSEDDYFNILGYDNYKAWWFLAITALLIILAALLISYRWKQMRQRELTMIEIIVNILAILALVILVITLIAFINNPILKAVFALFFAGVAYAKST